MGGKLFLVFVTTIIVILGLSGGAQGQEITEEPPMFTAHDFASSELQKRRTIQIGENCDSVFGTKLEAIVTEMEDHKDGGPELASRLRNQFTELMDQNKEVFLCVKTSWCDNNVCKDRAVQQGRAMGGAPPAKPAGAAPDAAPAGAAPAEAAPAGAAPANAPLAEHDAEETTSVKPKSSSAINSASTLFLTALVAAAFFTNAQ